MISSVYILADLYVGHGLTLNGITNTVYFCKPRIPKERRRKLFIIFEAFTFDTLKPLKLYLPGCKAHQFSYHFIMRFIVTHVYSTIKSGAFFSSKVLRRAILKEGDNEQQKLEK